MMENGDIVTLIARLRPFGKTLTISNARTVFLIVMRIVEIYLRNFLSGWKVRKLLLIQHLQHWSGLKKNICTKLIAKRITKEKIRKYRFAFEGKKVLMG